MPKTKRTDARDRDRSNHIEKKEEKVIDLDRVYDKDRRSRDYVSTNERYKSGSKKRREEEYDEDDEEYSDYEDEKYSEDDRDEEDYEDDYEDDDEDDYEDERSEDEESIGSLKDFIVDDEEVEKDISRAKKERKSKKDPLDGIDQSNIVTGKRRRKPVSRYIDDQYWKLMTADLDEKEVDEFVREVEEEDTRTPQDESNESDEEYDYNEDEEEDNDDDEDYEDEDELTPSDYDDEDYSDYEDEDDE